MIQFGYIEASLNDLRMSYLTAKPFPHVVIDGFCDEKELHELVHEVPDLSTRSRDYVFAANKFEKSDIEDISPRFAQLREDLLSERFRRALAYITNEQVFLDPAFHGGGLHQGKEGSFLDMHLDFNYHPTHPLWFREVNLLLYLNEGWRSGYGGHLLLEDLRTGARKKVGVPFNRLVIQQTRGFTLHGYDPIRFPRGRYRTSIASYAYTEHRRAVEKPRTTDWFVKDDAGAYKKILARVSKPLVKAKTVVFGSGTARN